MWDLGGENIESDQYAEHPQIRFFTNVQPLQPII